MEHNPGRGQDTWPQAEPSWSHLESTSAALLTSAPSQKLHGHVHQTCAQMHCCVLHVVCQKQTGWSTDDMLPRTGCRKACKHPHVCQVNRGLSSISLLQKVLTVFVPPRIGRCSHLFKRNFTTRRLSLRLQDMRHPHVSSRWRGSCEAAAAVYRANTDLFVTNSLKGSPGSRYSVAGQDDPRRDSPGGTQFLCAFRSDAQGSLRAPSRAAHLPLQQLFVHDKCLNE